jgi:hypothetical protein
LVPNEPWALAEPLVPESGGPGAKPGSKIHVLSEGAGLPFVIGVSTGNTNDAYALKPLVHATPAIRSRRKPDKLHADKAYNHTELRTWVRRRGIRVRIVRKGVETSEKLGRHRWVIERSVSWLTGYRGPMSKSQAADR